MHNPMIAILRRIFDIYFDKDLTYQMGYLILSKCSFPGRDLIGIVCRDVIGVIGRDAIRIIGRDVIRVIGRDAITVIGRDAMHRVSTYRQSNHRKPWQVWQKV